MANNFDVFMTQTQPFTVAAPKSGNTGSFDTFVTQTRPFPEYAKAPVGGAAGGGALSVGRHPRVWIGTNLHVGR